MTTVVLGWDGLDYELAGEFGLRDAFGDHHRRIETYDNPYIGEPHTRELWPSIVTGAPREDHQIWLTRSDDRKEWENPLVELSSRVASTVVPGGLRERVGALLLRAGAEGTAQKTPEYYRRRGLSTVFDGRRSKAVSIPNYVTEADEEHGFDFTRGRLFERVVEDGAKRYEPRKSLPVLEEVLHRMLMARLGVVDAALQYDYDIVFAWLGYLDTVGHVSSAVDGWGWQERAYRDAARLTGYVNSRLQADDALVCVSDHGLREGDHTHDPYYGATDEAAVEGVERVVDVRDGLERVTPSSDTDPAPSVREPYRCRRRGGSDTAADVEERLSDLGYI